MSFLPNWFSVACRRQDSAVLPGHFPRKIWGNKATVDDFETESSRLEDGYAEEVDEKDDGGVAERREHGYTPFEFIEFTDLPLKHEVSIWVDRSISDCYDIWESRLNWMQWFTMIDEIGFHEEEPSYMSMYLWYRWATTPFLELYVTLERTQEEKNKFILEEPVEGLPLVGAVLFQEGDEDTPGTGGTTVTLRLSYLLPKVLYEFAGQMAVYADVDKKLHACMEKMKSFVESVDMNVLSEIQKENEAKITSNFQQQRELKKKEKMREERAESWSTAAASVADMNPATAAEVDRELAMEDEVRGPKKQVRKGRSVKNPGKLTADSDGE